MLWYWRRLWDWPCSVTHRIGINPTYPLMNQMYTTYENGGPNQTSASAVIIASSARDNPGSNFVPRRGEADNPTRAGNLRGVLKDAGAMHAFLSSNGVHFGHGSFLAGVDPRLATKSTVLRECRLALQSRYQNQIFTYSGHGEMDTGAWCFDDGSTLTPRELFELIAQYPTKTVIIITDSCFGGKWVDFFNQIGRPNIFVQASCQSDDTAWDSENGGYFTQAFVHFAGRKASLRTQLWDMAWTYPRFVLYAGSMLNVFNTLSSPKATTSELVPVSPTMNLWLTNHWCTMHL